MFQLFALVASLMTGQPQLMVHHDTFPTEEACKAEMEAGKPLLETELAKQAYVLVGQECRKKEVDGTPA